MKMIKSGGVGFTRRTSSYLGILDDAPPVEKFGFWLESQAGFIESTNQ